MWLAVPAALGLRGSGWGAPSLHVDFRDQAGARTLGFCEVGGSQSSGSSPNPDIHTAMKQPSMPKSASTGQLGVASCSVDIPLRVRALSWKADDPVHITLLHQVEEGLELGPSHIVCEYPNHGVKGYEWVSTSTTPSVLWEVSWPLNKHTGMGFTGREMSNFTSS